jgi:HK97 family phage major capsid protein
MGTSTMERLRKELADTLTPARDIAAKAEAEGRDLTGEEREQVQKAVKDAAGIKARIDQAKADADLTAQIGDLGDGLALLPDGAKGRADIGGDGAALWTPRKGETLGQAFAKSRQLGDLLKRFPGGRIPDRAAINSEPFGAKALITGSSDTSAGAFVQTDYRGLAVGLDVFQRTLTMRNLVTNGNTTSDTVEYVRVTATTNNAAPVAESTTTATPGTQNPANGVKPESALTLEKVTESVKTIAHWLPATTRALADAGQIRTLIDTFLRYGLEEELEDQMVNGDGTGENFEGLTSVSGTQTQPWSATVDGLDPLLETTFKARTLVRTVGRSIPTAYVFNPADWERIHLARLAKNPNNEATMGAIPTLHGLPVVESEAIPAGSGWVADWRKAVLWGPGAGQHHRLEQPRGLLHPQHGRDPRGDAGRVRCAPAVGVRGDRPHRGLMTGPVPGVRCPLCGVEHAVCGQRAASQPVDIPQTAAEGRTMAVRKYRVNVRGTETIMRLNDRDLKQYPDAQPVDEPTTRSNKTTDTDTKTRTAANKARGAADKASG